MNKQRVANALLLLRLEIFVVVFVWARDEAINPQHSSGMIVFSPVDIFALE